MKVIELSKERINNLERLQINKGSIATEADLYIFYYNKIKYILKELYPFEYIKYENKLRTLLSIEANSSIIPDYFVKPMLFVSNGEAINYWGSNFIRGINLDIILNNEKIPFEIKKKNLIRIGSILKEMDDIRRNTSLKDFYIGDLHESNFIVDKNGQLLICDLDSIKINGNKSSNAKYLTPFSLFNKIDLSDKYKNDLSINRVGDYVANKNTDLYCYMMILLNFITNRRVNNIEIKNFYNYLNYFGDIGINNNLIEAFSRILSSDDNINPYEYVDTLSNKQISQVRVKKL